MSAAALVTALLFTTLMVRDAHAETITLITGETLEAIVVARTEDHLELDHPILGRLTVGIDDVRAIDGTPTDGGSEPAGAPSPPAEPGSVPATGPAPTPRIPVDPDPAVWTRRLELGLTTQQGVTQDFAGRAAVELIRTTSRSRVRYDARYRYATRDGERTEHRFSNGLFGERTHPESRWSTFGEIRFAADEFQSWDQRLLVNGGFGLELIRIEEEGDDAAVTERFYLRGRGGGGIRREFGSDDDDLNPEGLLGADFRLRLNSHQQVDGGVTFYPSLDDEGRYRVESKLDWTIAFENAEGVNLKVGLTYEYDANARAGISPSDFAAYAALVVSF